MGETWPKGITIRQKMYLLPLVSTLFSGIFSGSMLARYYGHRGSAIINVLCLFVAFISSLIMWYEVVFASCEVFVDLFGTWFTVGSFNVYWSLYFDLTTVHLLLTVTSVSFAVHCYALVYMKADPHLNLFMCYLSLFTFFMCVLVTGQDLILMLVGWEGINTKCPIDDNMLISLMFTRKFYKPRIPAQKRYGLHSSLFKQLLTGFMLGDGWLEIHGLGARLGISLTEKFADVANFYLTILYGLGYTDRNELGDPLTRKNNKTKPYYQIRTFTFASLIPYFNLWYNKVNGKVIKVLPTYEELYEQLTPFALAVWLMGDGSGMRDGGFKISSHSFNKEQNQLLCQLLYDLYGIKAAVLQEGHLHYIRVWKSSVPTLKALVAPYLLPSCDYKFRFVK